MWASKIPVPVELIESKLTVAEHSCFDTTYKGVANKTTGEDGLATPVLGTPNTG